MQWDSSAEAGFTTGTHPWLAVNPNYKEINAVREESDPSSVLNYVRALIELRVHTLAFVYGDYQDLDPQNEKISPTPGPSARISTSLSKTSAPAP
jgi:oligo-1,6-glucosidase